VEEAAVCRWLAYSGTPIRLEELLYRPDHSLIEQSRNARSGPQTTNGDGFGVAWYDQAEPGRPALFRSTGPAWSDQNLRELAGAVSSPLFLAHVRASTGTAVQQTNCHPFRHGSWVWLHNGLIRGFAQLKRELVLAVDPALYPSIEGSTDSEVMFHLALTLGLREDPVGAVERMVGLIEAVAAAHGVEHPLQLTVATTGGEELWVFRYSSEGRSRSLFYSTAVASLRRMYPGDERLRVVSDDTRIVVSEPLGDLVGAWQPVPESSYGVIRPGGDELAPLVPRAA
jgi:glutamine amidotransferase